MRKMTLTYRSINLHSAPGNPANQGRPGSTARDSDTSRRHSRGLRPFLIAMVVTLLALSLGTSDFAHVTLGSDNQHTTNAFRSVVTWRGGGGDMRWSNPANWEGSLVPGPSDRVRFSEAASRDAIVDPAFSGTIAGIIVEDGYSSTLTLARDLTVRGEIILAGGTFRQEASALTAWRYTQTGGTFAGGSADIAIDGPATVDRGTLTTPRAALTVNSLTINAPGTVVMAADGKLNLTGSGTPLKGTGRLDTITYRPNSVEYTGQAVADLTAAVPAAAYHAVPLAPLDFSEQGSLTLNATAENGLGSAVIDRAAGFAYFATNNSGTPNSPGIIVKIRLSDFKRVGALTLNAGETRLRAAVIDPAVGFAYFGTNTSPGIVVKVRLSDFTRTGALPLNAGEDYLSSAVIDPAAGFAYFGTNTSPGIVVKVRLSDFTRVGALPLNAGENELFSAVIDPAAGFAYFGTFIFGTGTEPGIVVKVRLSDFTRVGALTLNAGENGLFSAVIDPAAGFAYFGTGTSPGMVVKVRLSNFTRVGALPLNAGEDYAISAVIDPAAGFAYFGTSTEPGIVVKVRLSDLTLMGTLALNVADEYLDSAVIDQAAGFAYFGTNTSPGKVVKVRLSDFTRVGGLTLDVGEDYLRSAVIDPAEGFAYFGTHAGDSPGKVVKVRLSDFTRVGALTLNAGENFFDSAVIDPAADLAYFGTALTQPGIVVKVRLSDFTRVGALPLNDGEISLDSAVIDPAAGFAYFGTNTQPGIVVKVRLSNFTRAGALTLNDGENRLDAAVIDPAAGFAYFGTSTFPSIIVKVRLSDFTRVEALPLNAGENGLTSAVIDPAASFAYFGTFTSPGIVVKVSIASQADLSISKTDGRMTIMPGDAVTYTIKVVNQGPANVTGTVVRDTFPASLSGVSWLCSASVGSSCATGGIQSGDISTTLNLLVSGTATFTATATVSSSGSNIQLSNTATVSAPAGLIDPNPSNNNATDTDAPFNIYLPVLRK